MAEYIAQKQPLGGLLFLLPQKFSFQSKDGTGGDDQDSIVEHTRSILVELEQLLIHANIPVSERDYMLFAACTFLSLY